VEKMFPVLKEMEKLNNKELKELKKYVIMEPNVYNCLLFYGP
jgi:hypothetical protein